MRQRNIRGGLPLYCLFFSLGAALVFLLVSFEQATHRPLDTSVRVSLKSHVRSLGIASSKSAYPYQHGQATSTNLKDWVGKREQAWQGGDLPTQKLLQAALLINATKGRNRRGPILGCEQFQSRNFTWPDGMRRVAIVGNGPLTPDSRGEINAMDFVIRFNKLQSYVCGDKFDVWASRHGDAVSTRYWGIGQKLNVTDCPLEKLLKHSKTIWLMNGGDGPFNHFLQSYKQIRDHSHYLWIDCRKWVNRYFRLYDRTGRKSQDEVSPSSGWLVISMLRDCAPAGAEFHLYGFNWPGGQWPAHKVEDERDEISALAEQGELIIHRTLCKHKYHCNAT